MKQRIGSAIALVSVVITCVLVAGGCQPPRAYFTLDWGSAVMQPRFCLYRDRDFQQWLGVGGLQFGKYHVPLKGKINGNLTCRGKLVK